MAILASWDSGTLPTILGTGVSLAAAGGPSGQDAIQFDQEAANLSQVRFTYAARVSVAVRAYLRTPAAWPSGSQTLIAPRPNGASIVGRARLAGSGQPGEVRLSKADPEANTAVSGSGAVALSTWYRWELLVDQANGRGRLGVFPLAFDTPLYDSGWVTADFGSTTDRTDIGPLITSVTLGSVRAAGIVISDDVSGFIGRAAWDTTGPTLDIERPAPNLVDLRGSSGAGTLTYPAPTKVSGPTLTATSLDPGLWLFSQDSDEPAVYEVSATDTVGTVADEVTIAPLAVVVNVAAPRRPTGISPASTWA